MLYAIDTPYRAEDFLTNTHPEGSVQYDGALLIKQGPLLELGIYFSPTIQNQISHIPEDQNLATIPQGTLNAYLVTAEEISHFHYFLFHSEQGRPVSQLELEIQGEIDRFLLCFLSSKNPETDFEPLVDTLFEHYRLRQNLAPEQVERYDVASSLAKNFVLKHLRQLKSERHREAMVGFLRRYYRMASREKLEVAGKR